MGRALARIANTPRPLIQAIVSVMKPDPRAQPDFRICDPACGTGGFLVCGYEWLVSKEVSGGVFDRADARRIKSQTFVGQDLVPRPRRLSLMNLFLHGVEPHIYLGDAIYEPDRGERYDVVDDLREIVTLVEKEEGLTTDCTDYTDGKELNPCNPWSNTEAWRNEPRTSERLD